MAKFIRLKNLLGIAVTALILCGLWLWMDDDFLTRAPRAGLLQVDEKALHQFSNLLEELKLDSTQTAEVRVIFLHSKNTLQAAVVQSAKNAQALENLTGPDYDAAKVSVLAEKQGVLVSKAVQLRLETFQKVYQILNPEQKIKFLKGLFPSTIAANTIAGGRTPEESVIEKMDHIYELTTPAVNNVSSSTQAQAPKKP